jgi:hypothetical protein
MAMNSIRTLGNVLRTRHAAAVVALTAATPALAANFPLAMGPRDIVLLGAGVLLAVALALRVVNRRDTSNSVESSNPAVTAPDLPDLRWWKNSHA